MGLQGGSATLNAIGVRLELLGDKGLKEKVFLAIDESLKATEVEIKANAKQMLPASGGLNKWVEQAPIHERSKTISKTKFGAWIIQHKEGHDLRDIDRGRIKHPVFGKKNTPMVIQKVPAGYFSKPIIRSLPIIRKRIEHSVLKAIKGE